VDYEPLSEDVHGVQRAPLASNSVLASSMTSTVITSNSSGAITVGSTGSTGPTTSLEDLPVIVRFAEDSAARALQVQYLEHHQNSLLNFEFLLYTCSVLDCYSVGVLCDAREKQWIMRARVSSHHICVSKTHHVTRWSRYGQVKELAESFECTPQ
jgi:hypothetical protein